MSAVCLHLLLAVELAPLLLEIWVLVGCPPSLLSLFACCFLAVAAADEADTVADFGKVVALLFFLSTLITLLW